MNTPIWKQYDVYTTKEKILERANESFLGVQGGFVCTDGAWCTTSTPQEFSEMLSHFFGFKIVECKETSRSTAIAITECGLHISWNGFCRRI